MCVGVYARPHGAHDKTAKDDNEIITTKHDNYERVYKARFP